MFIGNYPGLNVLPITIGIAREAVTLRPILVEPGDALSPPPRACMASVC